MKSREALKVLAEVTESQWGMVTSAQVLAMGVSNMNLTRLTEAGDLIRLAHGVYKDAGTPSSEHDHIRCAWLATKPEKFSWQRIKENSGEVVVSGETAAKLHDIGNFRALTMEFTTSVRRQSQRKGIHFRTKELPGEDVTIRHGLPVTTIERTVADLVEDRAQISHIGDAIRDAANRTQLDTARLIELLGPLAQRNGKASGDGHALLESLLESAQIDADSLSARILEMPELSTQIAKNLLSTIEVSTLYENPAIKAMLTSQRENSAKFAEAINETLKPAIPKLDRLANSINAAIAQFDSKSIRAVLESQQKQLDALTKALEAISIPETLSNEVVSAVLQSAKQNQVGLLKGTDTERLSESVRSVKWASLAQQVRETVSSESVVE